MRFRLSVERLEFRDNPSGLLPVDPTNNPEPIPLDPYPIIGPSEIAPFPVLPPLDGGGSTELPTPPGAPDLPGNFPLPSSGGTLLNDLTNP